MSVLHLATVVDWKALGETALAALVAGTTITFTFSAAIYGATRAADMRRDGRSIESGLFAAFAALAVLASLAGVIAGLIVMIS
jgi:hypothetical protein